MAIVDFLYGKLSVELCELFFEVVDVSGIGELELATAVFQFVYFGDIELLILGHLDTGVGKFGNKI